MSNYNETKDKLLTKAFERKEFNDKPNPEFMPGYQKERPPLNVNLDYNPETDFKKVGVDYTKKGFNIGGDYQPGYSTERPGFFPGSTVQVENPSNYNVRAGYKNKNFGFNVNVGTGGNYGARMNFDRQF